MDVCFDANCESAVTIDEKICEALDIKTLRLPHSLGVTDVTFEDYTDSDGDPALRFSVTVAESADLENIPVEDIGELKFAIGDSLRKHGIIIFPYIFLAKPSELVRERECQNEDSSVVF